MIFDESMLPFVELDEKNCLLETLYPALVKQYAPLIFRYMDKKHVDEFFNTGKLRLISFEAFSKLDNLNLRDEKEENLKITIKCGDEVSEAEMGFGSDAFVLCATTINSDENYTKNTFRYNSVFSIEDVNALNNAFHTMLVKKGATTHRLQVESVQHGPCMYLLKLEHDVLIIEHQKNSITEFLCGRNEIVVDDMIETFS